MKYNQQEKFSLWFSFLKIAATDPPFLREEIKWGRYEGWGKIPTIQTLSFEKWWEKYGKEIQNPVVKVVESIPANPPSETIYLKIPLNRGPRRILSRARHIILAKFKKIYGGRVQTSKGRFKRGFYGQYENACFTEGREIRVEYYRNLLDLYKAVFREHPRLVGMEALKTINAVAKRNAERNAGRVAKGLKPTLPEFRIYTTAFMTDKELELVIERSILENYRKWMKRGQEERAARIAAGLETDAEWMPRRKETVADKRLDYQKNPHARLALLNLHRAKEALRVVINAVARGEFPGKSV